VGGFFSTPSDFTYPFSSVNQSFSRCKRCTEKYEQDVAVIQKGGSTISVADQHSESLPSWLRMAELDTGEGVGVAKVCNCSKFNFLDSRVDKCMLTTNTQKRV